MYSRNARAREILLGIVHEVRREKLTFMAGSIAYHAFLSILPLLLLLFAIVERTRNVALGEAVVGIVQGILTEEAGEVIQQGLAEADASVSVLGAVFLVYAVRLYREEDPSLPMKTFGYSIIYLMGLFSALLFDHYL